MGDPVATPPAICLTMIVRNEAHVVRELLDSVAPHIASWVIVDTGSDDGTQDIIREHMAALGIPGQLHERPWRDFGSNRTEALALAQGHGDYLWVQDADDVVVGTPDFRSLTADVYQMRCKSGATYWYPLLFRNGIQVRYHGVTHEHPRWDRSAVVARFDGEYHIEDRQRSSRNLSGAKLANDRDLLLAEVARDPADARSVFYLAQSYFGLGDFSNARRWYARRVELGGWDQEVYYALWRIAESMARQGESWLDVQDAYLRAWEFRPTRAEALYAVARHYRLAKRYRLAYLFAEHAARIPLPGDDILFVDTDIHTWRALDQQAVCAYWIDQPREAFTLCRRLVAHTEIPDRDRQRISRNRDFSVSAMIEAASAYPQALADSLPAARRDADVTVTVIADRDRADTEHTLDSFLNCCTDVSKVGRFLVFDAGLSAIDRAALSQRYRFLEFTDHRPGLGLTELREQIGGRFWLHLGRGWRFFAPENLISRMTAVLDIEPEVFQVGVNFTDATTLTGACAAEETVRRNPVTGRYVFGDVAAHGPALFDTARLDRIGLLDDDDRPRSAAALTRRAGDAGLRTASLDEVLCIVDGAVSGQS